MGDHISTSWAHRLILKSCLADGLVLTKEDWTSHWNLHDIGWTKRPELPPSTLGMRKKKEFCEARYHLGWALWKLTKQWYGGCFGYTGHEVRGEVFELFRKSATQNHQTSTASLEAMKFGQTERCSNGLCGKHKDECPGGTLPVQCMRCSFELYCSLQCLAADWKARHKNDCRPWSE